MTAKTSRTFLFAMMMLGLFVPPASANAPSGRYTISNGTVKDNKTGLTWQQATGSDICWTEAMSYCSTQGGGWRLPTAKELLTLYDYSKSSGALIDLTAFPGTSSASEGVFWSSTKLASDQTQAWEVAFVLYFGNVLPAGINATQCASSARCVR